MLSHLLRVALPVVYMKDILASTNCVFLYLHKVEELEQELAECEDGLDHYQNIVSSKLYLIFNKRMQKSPG